MKTSRIACVAIATLLTFGSFARATSLEHVDELAVTAERQARQVVYQTYSLHSYGPAAQELKRNAFEMIRLARHIHQVAHVDDHGHHGRHGVRTAIDRMAHINRDLVDLDRLMHAMQDQVARMKLRTPARRPTYDHHRRGNVSVSFGRGFSININGGRGSGYHGYHGGHHGSSFRAPSTLDRVDISLAKLAETVHHMLDDTEVVCIRRR